MEQRIVQNTYLRKVKLVFSLKYLIKKIHLMVGMIKTIHCKIYYRFSSHFRNRYWNKRAPDVHAVYGRETSDFIILERLISSIMPRNVLDIGCGSGRLFPLYIKMGINEAVGQDVSVAALEIAGQNHYSPKIQTINKSILELNYPLCYFDLIVSNRVLQHIPPNQIERIIAKIVLLGKTIYINELSDSDGLEENFYMFIHNYEQFFGRYGLKSFRSGLLGRQTWSLFGRI